MSPTTKTPARPSSKAPNAQFRRLTKMQQQRVLELYHWLVRQVFPIRVEKTTETARQ
jgi:hypothetical protein